ncbi:MAG: hypothetical protein EXS14_04740 [Planctomycetes bacterium]|nr:hypothetical protein [Planctomycetota bacterium]
MKSNRDLLFSSFNSGKLQPGLQHKPPVPLAHLAILAGFLCVVIAGVSYYLWPESESQTPQGVRLSATGTARDSTISKESRTAAGEPEVFWSVRVMTIGRAAEGADPAPLVQRALKAKRQLEDQGFSPVFALSDLVSGKREYWVSVGRSRNPDELKDLERRLERTSLGSEKPFQDAYVCRVAVPPR